MQILKNSANRIFMVRAIGLTLARFLAMLAIVLQAVLPGSLAVAQSHGVDVSRFICAPSGQASPKIRLAAERIAKRLDANVPDERSVDRDCPLCALAHGIPVPRPITLAVPHAFAREHISVPFEPGPVRKVQGPPLGSRGPPATL